MLLNSTHVKADMHSGVLVASITCEKIDNYESEILRSDLLPLATGIGKVALDLKEVQLMAPIGLGLISALQQACVSRHGRLVMFNVNKELQKLLKMTPLSGVGVYKNEDAAIRALT